MCPDQNGWEGPDKTWTSGGTDVTPRKLKTVWRGAGAYVRGAGLGSAKFHMSLIEMCYECLTSWLIVLGEGSYLLSLCLLFCFVFVLYLSLFIVMTFNRKGIEFLSLEDKSSHFWNRDGCVEEGKLYTYLSWYGSSFICISQHLYINILEPVLRTNNIYLYKYNYIFIY